MRTTIISSSYDDIKLDFFPVNFDKLQITFQMAILTDVSSGALNANVPNFLFNYPEQKQNITNVRHIPIPYEYKKWVVEIFFELFLANVHLSFVILYAQIVRYTGTQYVTELRPKIFSIVLT